MGTDPKGPNRIGALKALIRFQADADLQHRIVVAVRKQEPAIDFASAVESELRGVPDPEVLEIPASQGRILITHDRRTMLEYFRRRLEVGKQSPGLFVVSQAELIGTVVEALLMVWAASVASDWENQVRYLPSFSRHLFSR